VFWFVRFVNGKEYFAALRDVLKTAKIRIFVTDWFFSPGLYLTREDPLNQEDRLDRLLLAKAKQVSLSLSLSLSLIFIYSRYS
jgi:hypothetical protein